MGTITRSHFLVPHYVFIGKQTNCNCVGCRDYMGFRGLHLPSNPTSMINNNNKIASPTWCVCTRVIKDGDNSLCCDGCNTWYHAGCDKVSVKLFEVINKHQELMWFCRKCKPHVARCMDKVRKMERDIKELNKDSGHARSARNGRE